MAIQVRHGEKTVLRAAIKEAKALIGSNKRMRLEGKNGSTGEDRKGKRSTRKQYVQRKRGGSNNPQRKACHPRFSCSFLFCLRALCPRQNVFISFLGCSFER
jgi:hypothetical protein